MITPKQIQELSTCGIKPNFDNICMRAKLDTGYQCNYKCFFCYYKSKLNEFTPFEVIKNRIDTLYDLGCRDFDLSGGESSIHKDFFKILEYLQSKQVKISCLSNGLKFSNFDFIAKAKDYGLSEILFSLHSIGNTHDLITGVPNSYKKIIKAIENAKKLNIKIRINSTITQFNYSLVDTDFYKIVESLNPFEINFLPLNYFDCASNLKNIKYSELLRPIKNFLNKSKIKYKNVRYVPFCQMRGFEKYVVGYYQHIYDIYDWNLAWYDYKPISTIFDCAKQNRIRNYVKDIKCMKCKYFYICDGFEPQSIPEFEPEFGTKISDANYFRHDFYKS